MHRGAQRIGGGNREKHFGFDYLDKASALLPSMSLIFRHGVIEPLLGGDRLAVLAVELAVCAVDIDVPPRLNVLVALD